MKRIVLALLLLCTLLQAGCWDRLEVEDQLFPVTAAVDAGQLHRYRVMLRVPMVAQMRAGVLGGQGGGGSAMGTEVLTAEADSVAQAVLIINASVARRITLRHMRALIVGEAVARAGLHDLLSEMIRNSEVRETVAMMVARGTAEEVMKKARFPGESNAAKLTEGILLVEKQLHLAPPIRLHHFVNRSAGVGVDPIAPVIAINPRATGGEGGSPAGESAVAGELDRFDGNPVENAGTAVFRDDHLMGFLTVDETQALLALRGEMGKAYLTIPHPTKKGETVLVRFQQENKPTGPVQITPQGPRVAIRLLFEGEVLSGRDDYQDDANRRGLEKSAGVFMQNLARNVLRKQIEWQVDPVGLGLKARRRFPTWEAWMQYNWRRHLPDLQTSVAAEMRVRRFGLTLGTERIEESKN